MATLLLLVGWCCLLSARAAALSVHVDAIHGNDASGTGSSSAPLATVQKAKQLVRDQRSKGFTDAVDVMLHNGTYEVAQPLVFDALDGGVSFASPTTYKAAANAHPVFVGGKVLKLAWTKDIARGANVWKANLTGYDDQIPALFVGGKRMWPARWPNADVRFPTIFGAGYVTASGGINSIPCSFRSPAVSINKKSCSLSNIERSYPAQPPTGLTFPPSIASPVKPHTHPII